MSSVAVLSPDRLVRSKQPFYRPELDCLRFGAFLAVFCYHTLPRNVPLLGNAVWACSFGVDLFFCLSAYLITELLLREKEETGQLNVKAFYIRRILRIWPLYFTFLLFAFALSSIDHTEKFPISQLIPFLLLAGNWAVALHPLALVSVAIPLWSVSIEEQFYLLWPLIVRRATGKRILGVCMGMITAAFVWRWFVRGDEAMIWNGTFSHLDTIAYGIAFAVLEISPQSTRLRMALLLSGISAWVLAASLRAHGALMMPLVALGSVAILASAIGVKIDHPALRKLGVVSYGLYVYHELFRDLVSRLLPNTHGLHFVEWWTLTLASTIGIALISYRWLETPFLRLKRRFTIVQSRPI